MIFKDQTNLPSPEPIKNSEDSIIDVVSTECGSYLSSTPIKMESLIVESKEQMSAFEKREAKAEYQKAKSQGMQNPHRGRPKMNYDFHQKPTAHVRPMPQVPMLGKGEKTYINISIKCKYRRVFIS